MEIIDSKKVYRTPHTKVAEVNVHAVLCSSPEQRQDWENGGDI